jgi:PAS domain S-box-containing protein
VNRKLEQTQKKPNLSLAAAQLRRCAEERLREQHPETAPARNPADTQRLLHELHVHQIELEMQNEELQQARNELEAGLEKYTDLYDFAPVGYLSLDEQGRVLEVNLTGATLLGAERSRLINRRLEQFVVPTSQPGFRRFLEQVFAGTGKPACEAALLREDGAAFWANFHGASALSASGPRKSCRVAVSDISSLKEAEAARRRMEALAVTNRKLRREIVRRQAVEEALKNSKQYQSRLLERSRDMQERLRHLSHQILQAQEEERRRISRELHDEIAQTLVGINVHLETLAREATFNPRELKREIARTQRLVGKSVDIVHHFARELRPATLDDLGLIATLHSFMKDFMKRTGIRVHFTTSAGVERLDTARRTVLYRVVQSALANVAQHAHASRVKVSIRKLRDAVHMKITDNGKSFDVERLSHTRKNKHLGLLGMRERVEMVGGNLSVQSASGQGTTIGAQIPLRAQPGAEEGAAGPSEAGL